MPPNRFESEVESFLEGSHGDRTHIKRADHPRLHHYAGRYSFWIGYCVLDRLITYPELFFLSKTAFPIQNSNACAKAVWMSRFPLAMPSAPSTPPHQFRT